MSVATKPASVRITEDMAAEQRLTVTDAELAEEIEIYVDMREGDMKGYDREVLLEAALRLRKVFSELPEPPQFFCDVVVISDGENNRYPERQGPLQEKARLALAYGFTLRAIGFGIDHNQLSRDLGFDPSAGVTVPATQEGIREVWRQTSQTFTGTIMHATTGGGFRSTPPSK